MKQLILLFLILTTSLANAQSCETIEKYKAKIAKAADPFEAMAFSLEMQEALNLEILEEQEMLDQLLSTFEPKFDDEIIKAPDFEEEKIDEFAQSPEDEAFDRWMIQTIKQKSDLENLNLSRISSDPAKLFTLKEIAKKLFIFEISGKGLKQDYVDTIWLHLNS